MDLKELQEVGGLYTGKPVKKHIIWDKIDSETGDVEQIEFDVFVRKIPYGEFEQALKADSYSTYLISAGIRLGENGQERLDMDQSALLAPTLAQAFMQAVGEVNNNTKKKASTQTSESGSTLCSTESAEKP